MLLGQKKTSLETLESCHRQFVILPTFTFLWGETMVIGKLLKSLLGGDSKASTPKEIQGNAFNYNGLKNEPNPSLKMENFGRQATLVVS